MPNISSSFNLTQLDFDTYKTSLKNYLKSQTIFKDYDFDGSNMSVLLDLLSYNTYQNAFFLNMIGSEMFLDSAQLRDSVISHAKELNYLPRSFKSSVADISLVISSTDTSKTFLTMPKGTTFTSKIGSNSYTFSTDQNIVISQDSILSNSSLLIYTSNNVLVYEGSYVTDTFNVDYSSNNTQRFILSNPTIDIDSLSVSVIEDLGSTILNYQRAISLFGLDANSQNYFLQGTNNDQYELIFGDNILGRSPKDNSLIMAQYRICNGQLPNGANKFTSDGTIGGESNITVITNSIAQGGDINETIESIKYYAPRHFTTQERAVTANDYETLLKINFPEIGAISAYGGEELSPPQYGKVYISLSINGFSGIPLSKKTEYNDFLLSRNALNVTPVFVEPEFMYISVDVIVNYDTTSTTLSPQDINTLVISSIMNYNTTYINDFKSQFRFSNLIEKIDIADNSIISNETSIKIMKKINPLLNVSQNYNIAFDLQLLNSGIPTPSTHDVSVQDMITVRTSNFISNGKLVHIEDDGLGSLRLMQTILGTDYTLYNIGTVDYDTGNIIINGLIVNTYIGDSIRIYVKSLNQDVASSKHIILAIPNDEINVTVNQIRSQ